METPMKIRLAFTGDAKTLSAPTRFLEQFEKLTSEPLTSPKAVQGEDNVMYVEAEYRTEEDTFVVGDHIAAIGADIVEATGVLIALAPFVAGEK
jgi:hypothetical protein